MTSIQQRQGSLRTQTAETVPEQSDLGTSGSLSAAPLREPEVWRTIVLGMPRTGRITPAVQAVARQLDRQVRIAAREGRWLSAQVLGD